MPGNHNKYHATTTVSIQNSTFTLVKNKQISYETQDPLNEEEIMPGTGNQPIIQSLRIENFEEEATTTTWINRHNP